MVLRHYLKYPRIDALLATAAAIFFAALTSEASAQKSGGTLRIYNSSNPPSASIHEEATIATVMPFSPVFNNLVMFDQTKKRNSPETIIPELAESWAWDATKTRLTFKLRKDVKWHDDKPFTAKDVVCTWERIQGKGDDPLRKNPRKVWYKNLREVTFNGDHEVTFVLNRPQVSLLMMLASGYSPVYPCHVSTKDQRTKPIGTGPFKFVEFDANKSIKLTRNPSYWKRGQPYLDAIEWRIIPNRSTRVLAFSADEFDLTVAGDITVPLMGDVKARSPKAICELVPTGVSTNLLVNRTKPPFDDARLRRAMALAMDRVSMSQITSQGASPISGAMLARPEGLWGMPTEMLMALPGYGTDMTARLAEARKIVESLGYGPDKKLKVKVSTRDFQAYKDPAVVLVDQLNKIHFDAELEIIESSVWYGRVARGDISVGLNLTGAGIDDPDVTIAENYTCESERNYTKYCDKDVERMISEQSQEADVEKRRKIVWEIERKLAEDVARPIFYHNKAATCWQPHLKGHVLHENSIYNNWRLDHVWLDR